MKHLITCLLFCVLIACGDGKKFLEKCSNDEACSEGVCGDPENFCTLGCDTKSQCINAFHLKHAECDDGRQLCMLPCNDDIQCSSRGMVCKTSINVCGFKADKN